MIIEKFIFIFYEYLQFSVFFFFQISVTDKNSIWISLFLLLFFVSLIKASSIHKMIEVK